MSPIRKHISSFRLALTAIILIKATLSAVTLSPDTEAYATQFMAGSILLRSTPWGLVNWVMYQLWFRLPIDKTDLISNPSSIRTLSLLSSSLLLTIKLPAISLDALIGLALYLHSKHEASVRAGRRAVLAWFANPFSMLIIEMWGSLAVLATSLLTLMLIAFVWHRKIFSAAIGAIAVAIAPILGIVTPALWIHLAQARQGKTLLLHITCVLLGLGGYVRWTSDLNLDPRRLLSIDTPYTLALTDFFADPYVLFGANIGIGTSLALGYVIYAYVTPSESASSGVDITYGAIAILIAFSAWSLALPLLLVPYLCFLMKDGFSTIQSNTALLLISLLPVWTILAGAPQLFRSGTSFLFIPGMPTASLQFVVENAATVFLLTPFVRGLLTAALMVISFSASRSRRQIHLDGISL